MAQLMPLPLTVSCFSKILIGFTFLVPAHLGSPGQRAVKSARACVCVTTKITDYMIVLFAGDLLMREDTEYAVVGWKAEHPL